MFTQSGSLLFGRNQRFLEEIPLTSKEEEIYCQPLPLQLRASIVFISLIIALLEVCN